MITTRALISSLAVLGLGGVIAAQTPALNVKPGLWEMTVITNIGGMPPVDTSKMSPQQAAQMADAMKAMSGDKTTTDKHCVRKEDLEKDSFMLPQNAGMTCNRTVTTNTATQFVADIACTGTAEMKGHMSIETQAGGTAFSGSTKMSTQAQGRAMDVSLKMSGKYLGADCGTVK